MLRILSLGLLLTSLSSYAGAIERISVEGELNKSASKVLASAEKKCWIDYGGSIMGDIKIAEEQVQDPDKGVMVRYTASLDCGYH
jgi:hypothetical protein